MKKPSKKTNSENKKPIKKVSKKSTKKTPIKRKELSKEEQERLNMLLNASNKVSKLSKSDKNLANKINEKQKKELDKLFGMILGKASKVMLEKSGMNVNYQVNGEDISDIKKLNEMDLKQKIDLAIKEERYEDAQKLKNILDSKSNSNDTDAELNKIFNDIENNYNQLDYNNDFRIDINVGNVGNAGKFYKASGAVPNEQDENRINCYKFLEEVRGRFITKTSFISFLNQAKDIVNVRIKNVDTNLVLVEVSDDDIMPHFFISEGNSKEFVSYVKKLK